MRGFYMRVRFSGWMLFFLALLTFALLMGVYKLGDALAGRF